MSACDRVEHDRIINKLLNNNEFDSQVDLASDIFKVLGEKNRLRIVLALVNGELCVYHICEVTNGSQSATSQHLKKLKDHNIVKSRKVGNEVLYSLKDEHIVSVLNTVLTHLDCK